MALTLRVVWEPYESLQGGDVGPKPHAYWNPREHLCGVAGLHRRRRRPSRHPGEEPSDPDQGVCQCNGDPQQQQSLPGDGISDGKSWTVSLKTPRTQSSG